MDEKHSIDELPDEEVETGGELDHTATAIPLDKLVASNVPVKDEED